MTEPRRILFICEHGSAKSVIAAAHFERMAREMGIDAHATSRGTDPDVEYPPHVLAGLSADEVEAVDESPLPLSTEDLESATEVIAFCPPHILPENVVVTELWDDVPPVSESYERARDEIVSRVRRLLS